MNAVISSSMRTTARVAKHDRSVDVFSISYDIKLRIAYEAKRPVTAIARTLLTLLGAACEEVGFHRPLKINTSKKRTHSLLTQGR